MFAPSLPWELSLSSAGTPTARGSQKFAKLPAKKHSVANHPGEERSAIDMVSAENRSDLNDFADYNAWRTLQLRLKLFAERHLQTNPLTQCHLTTQTSQSMISESFLWNANAISVKSRGSEVQYTDGFAR